MRKSMILFGLVVLGALVLGQGSLWAKEVHYTLEDRDRLIRVEAKLGEMEKRFEGRFEEIDKRFEEIDKRFEGIDKRFERIDKRIDRLEDVVIGGFGLLFTSMVGLVGFVLWDRRSALAPAIRKNKELEEEEEKIKRALREYALQEPRLSAILKQVGLL